MSPCDKLISSPLTNQRLLQHRLYFNPYQLKVHPTRLLARCPAAAYRREVEYGTDKLDIVDKADQCLPRPSKLSVMEV